MLSATLYLKFILITNVLTIQTCGQVLSKVNIQMLFFSPFQMNIQCPDCPLKFPMAIVLKYHREKAHQAKCEICTICGKKVRCMKIHLKVHKNEKQLQCDMCDFQCNAKSSLKRHMYTHSEDPMEGRKHKCELCMKAFFNKYDLKQHLLTHGKIRPYQCKLCSGTFTNFSGHRQHMMKTVRILLFLIITVSYYF